MRYREHTLQVGAIYFLRLLEKAGHLLTCAGDQNAAVRSGRAQADAKAAGMTAGEPDIRIYLDRGRLLSLELKTNAGSVQKSQKDRHARLRDLGHEVIVLAAATPAEMIREVASAILPYLEYDDPFDLQDVRDAAIAHMEKLFTPRHLPKRQIKTT